jgi:hypothetical protein
MSELSPIEDLETEIVLSHRRLMEEPQDRYPSSDTRRYRRGELVNPAAQIFEARMNRALEEYLSLTDMMGAAAILGEQKAA